MKYLILGAGPSGLTFANMLFRSGEKDFLVIESEKEAGGLCRSREVDGSPFDMGGGHFLDSDNPVAKNFVFDFMPEKEWNTYERDSRIDLYGNIIGSPIEANIWQLPEDSRKRYLDSIAAAGCNNGAKKPERFIEWIEWKLGRAICEDYMIPYNKKMFGENLNELGTYWLEKLPNVSYEETRLSCLDRRPYGTQPGHTVFYYHKKYGYGEAFLRMAGELGDRIVYGEPVFSIDYDSLIVNGRYTAGTIINTVPWNSIDNHINLPSELKDIISGLKYSSVVTEYHRENLDTKAHWIYYPQPELSYHRILVRHNFCTGSKGFWTETNLNRFDVRRAHEEKREYFINKYAYPLNTIGKPENMEKLLSYMRKRNIYGLGRWGEWQHYNSDVVIQKAIELVKTLKG